MLLDELDLRDVTLVGHSMGTGEVTRHLGNYGSGCVPRRRARLADPAVPAETDDNPEGLPGSLFLGFVESAKADIPAWMKGFLDNFYNMDKYAGKLVSRRRSQAASACSGRIGDRSRGVHPDLGD